jgi:hypothetical protein
MLRHIFVTVLLAASAQAALAAQAGKVIFVAGAAHSNAAAVKLGGAVNEGDHLSTGQDGYIYIKTVDNGLLVLRPNTRARIAAYHVDQANPANTRIKLELLSGVMRSQSGEAVKLARQNFRFNTPVAAIGVRGTDFTVFTDEQTSRVAVLDGGITMSGFAGACRPEGHGPCEGAASRELSASQKGQLLQIQRGQAAAQLMQGGPLSPDVSAPPRPDEPAAVPASASVNGAALVAPPPLDPVNSNNVSQKAAEARNNAPPGDKPPITTPPPIVVPTDPVAELPDEQEQPNPGGGAQQPGTGPVDPAPVVPERNIVWGRFKAIAGLPAPGMKLAEASANAELVATSGAYALLRTPGKEYVTPERGSVGFRLTGGEAVITSDNVTVAPVMATLDKGSLTFDFDKKKFATSIDLLVNTDRYTLTGTGSVARDGRFGVDNAYAPGNNMSATGLLSNENGGSAAYIFRSRIGGELTANGIALWGR